MVTWYGMGPLLKCLTEIGLEVRLGKNNLYTQLIHLYVIFKWYKKERETNSLAHAVDPHVGIPLGNPIYLPEDFFANEVLMFKICATNPTLGSHYQS
jgi:hypothetical protein